MAIFVNEPGRPRGTQISTAIKSQPVATVTQTTPTQAVDPKKNETTDAEIVNAMRSTERAMAEYSGVLRTEPDAQGAYVPVSVLATERLVSLPAIATMGEALAVMEQHGINHIALTEDGHSVGLVSADWIIHWLYQQQADADEQAFNDIELPSFLIALPETDAHVLARLMLAHQRRAALIVNKATLPVGIVTATDYLRLYAESGSLENRV